jgi:exodeoxyribonuclease VII small subunit
MKDKDLNFEKALADLEATVDKLEKGGQSLNESLALFEKGVKLARFLRDELDKAEKKVEILLKDEKGGFQARPFGQEGEEAEELTAEDSADDDDDDEEAEEKPKRKPKTAKKPGDDSALPF